MSFFKPPFFTSYIFGYHIADIKFHELDSIKIFMFLEKKSLTVNDFVSSYGYGTVRNYFFKMYYF